MRCRRLRAAAAVVLAGAALAPGAAHAAAAPPASFQALYDEYQRLGVIFGCAHRPADLRSALSSIPPDIEAYDPGFADALDSALEQQASGCSAASSPLQQAAASAGTTTAPDGSPGPANKQGPATVASPEQADTSIPPALAAVAGLAGALLLAATGLAIARRLGWGRGPVA